MLNMILQIKKQKKTKNKHHKQPFQFNFWYFIFQPFSDKF